jgi:hypothetical protein
MYSMSPPHPYNIVGAFECILLLLIFLSEAAFTSCAPSVLRFCAVDSSAQTNRAIAVSVSSVPTLPIPALFVLALLFLLVLFLLFLLLFVLFLLFLFLLLLFLLFLFLFFLSLLCPFFVPSYHIPSPLDSPLRTISGACSSSGYQNTCDTRKANRMVRIIKG